MEYISPVVLKDIETRIFQSLFDEYISTPLNNFDDNDIEGAINYFENMKRGLWRQNVGIGGSFALLDETECYLAFAYLEQYDPTLDNLPLDLAKGLFRIFIKVSDIRVLRRLPPPMTYETLQLFLQSRVSIGNIDLNLGILRRSGAFSDERLNIVASASYLYPLCEKQIVALRAHAENHVYPRRNARKMAYTIGHPNQHKKNVEDPELGVRPELGFRDLPDELKKEIAKMAGK